MNGHAIAGERDALARPLAAALASLALARFGIDPLQGTHLERMWTAAARVAGTLPLWLAWRSLMSYLGAVPLLALPTVRDRDDPYH